MWMSGLERSHVSREWNRQVESVRRHIFLSALAEVPLLDAAMSVRDETGRNGDVSSIFHRTGGNGGHSQDLGQPAKAKITFLRYEVRLAYRKDEGTPSPSRLELVYESLTHIRMGDAHSHLLFPHAVGNWRRTAVRGQGTAHRTAPFISTEEGEGKIRVHQDGGSGNARSLLAASLPRTALSTVSEFPVVGIGASAGGWRHSKPSSPPCRPTTLRGWRWCWYSTWPGTTRACSPS